MAKRKIILPVALVALILVAAVAFAACAPSLLAPAWEDYYDEYGEYYNNIVKSGRVRYRDVESGLYGYLDASGNVAIPAKYSSATSFGDGFAVVRVGSTYSVIDEDGGVIEGGFTSYTKNPSGVVVGKDGMYGVYNKDGCVLPVEYDSITANYSNYIIERNGKYGLADLSGKVLIQPIYDSGSVVTNYQANMSDGSVIFSDTKEDKFIYVNSDGKEIYTSYNEDEVIGYIGFGRYIKGLATSDDGNPVICEDDLTTVVAKLPDGTFPASGAMLDDDRIVLREDTSGDAKYFVYNLETGERQPVELVESGVVNNTFAVFIKEGDAYNFYANGEVTFTANEEEISNLFPAGSHYLYNKITNTLTDLLTGEQLTLSREIVDVTAAVEGIFAVMNAEGKYGVCAKNGDMIGDFIYSSVTVMADGFIGERRLSGGGTVYEWCGFDGNVILRSADMQIYAN